MSDRSKNREMEKEGAIMRQQKREKQRRKKRIKKA
jgi:hypothetical protein